METVHLVKRSTAFHSFGCSITLDMGPLTTCNDCDSKASVVCVGAEGEHGEG